MMAKLEIDKSNRPRVQDGKDTADMAGFVQRSEVSCMAADMEPSVAFKDTNTLCTFLPVTVNVAKLGRIVPPARTHLTIIMCGGSEV